jgi:Leucine-rich repeat (LRR) protein
METATSINSTGVTIHSDQDDDMKRLSLSNNKNIFYLPENIDEDFPNLMRYNAKRCSITAITKKNFKGLSKLTKLNLWGNQIERITSETFKDLTDLEVLSLGEKSFGFYD